MLGHNAFHIPMDKKLENLPWFETDLGIRRLAWVLGGVLVLYWGWFLFYLADAMRDGLLVPKVLVGLVPLALIAALVTSRPRIGGIATILLGLIAAAMVPGIDVAVMLVVLSLSAGGLMAFSTHK